MCPHLQPEPLGAQPSGVRDTWAMLHLGEEQRKVLSGTTRIRLEGPFPDSTRRGDAKAGDNNQIQVALVFQYLLS